MKIKFISILTTLIITAGVLPSVSVSAATLVNNQTDLRSAISSAATKVATTIELTADITLTGSTLSVTSQKIIILTGDYTLSCGGSYAALTVDGNAQCTLDGPTITHASGLSGHGVTVSTGGNLTISSGKITGNTGSSGGGIYNAGRVTMDGGEISNNKVTGTNPGAGILNAGASAHLVMNGGEIYGNTAAGNGGGVSVSSIGPSITINGGEIYKNTATGNGGGVYAGSGATLTINGGEIFNNKAQNAGGVMVNGSTTVFTMTGGVISGNTGEFAGGVQNNGKFTMDDGEITGNTATTNLTYGGAGAVRNEGTFTMNGGKIHGNDAGSANSPAVRNTGTFTMTDGEIYDSRNYGGKSLSIGILQRDDGRFTMENGKIYGNSVGVEGSFDIRGGEIYDNDIGLRETGWSYGGFMSGGDVYNNKIGVEPAFGEFTLKGGKIHDNSQDGVHNTHYGTVFNMSDGEVYGNASNGVFNGGTFNMSNGLIFENKSGGVYNVGEFNMDGGEIYGNTAIDGGGVHSTTNNHFTMNGGKIYDNTATGNGGGVYCWGYPRIDDMAFWELTMEIGWEEAEELIRSGDISSVLFVNSFFLNGGEIYGNQAKNGGGFFNDGSPFVMAGGAISGNTANDGNGGGVYNLRRTEMDWMHDVELQSGDIFMAGGTISDNKAPDGDGGAIYTDSLANVTVGANAVFSGNLANEGYMIEPSDIPLHEEKILTDTFSWKLEYGYNNHDVSYRSDTVLGSSPSPSSPPSKQTPSLMSPNYPYDGGTVSPSPSPTPAPSPGAPVFNRETHDWYVAGYPGNLIMPDESISRAEMAMILYRLMADAERGVITAVGVLQDINPAEWYAQAVTYLYDHDIISGYPDGTYKPDSPITRAEIAAMVSMFDSLEAPTLDIFTDVPSSHWAYSFIGSAAQKGWVQSYDDGSFRPDDHATRAEMIAFINNVLGRKVKKEELPLDVHIWDDLPLSHWAYADIMEAAHSHIYERQSETDYETWINITETSQNRPTT